MVAEDVLAAALAEVRERAVSVLDPEVMNLVRTYRAVESARDVPVLLAAVDAVLEMHAPTACVAYTEACTAHLFRISAWRTCRDCVRIERPGCQRCRDENGNPARPEDCAERNAILTAMTGEEKADA
jgi:hypothetical protein